MKWLKKILLSITILMVLFLAVYFIFLRKKFPISVIRHSFSIGDSVDALNGITVYNNGAVYGRSFGRHYNADSSFYYGKKWQCVEFIKRYYHDYLHHEMPDGFGNAHSFFDTAVPQGGLNKRRRLIQYRNGGNERPRVNDILVFDGNYGHVGIVSQVSGNELELVQQNIYLQPRVKIPIRISDGKVFVGNNHPPLGWLRVDPRN